MPSVGETIKYLEDLLEEAESEKKNRNADFVFGYFKAGIEATIEKVKSISPRMNVYNGDIKRMEDLIRNEKLKNNEWSENKIQTYEKSIELLKWEKGN